MWQRFTLRRSASSTPPSFAVPSARTILPRQALWMDSGCSVISLSMKWGNPPRSMSGKAEGDLLHALAHRRAFEGPRLEPVAVKHGHLPVVEVDHLPRVGHQGRGIAGDERPVLPQAQHDGAAVPGHVERCRRRRPTEPRCRRLPRGASAPRGTRRRNPAPSSGAPR